MLDERDYTSNLVATDRNWFYKNLDGSDQDPLVGDGQFNSLEYLAGRAWQIRTVAYLRGNSLVMRLKFRNTYRNAIIANLHWSAVRLKVPAGFNRPTETYIHLTPPPDQQFTMGAWNGTADVTVTISGVPNHVAFGDLQLQAEMTALSGYPPGENIWVLPVLPDGWAEWERVYLPFAGPSDLQSVPWTDVLNYTCNWAYGSTSSSQVENNLTLGMFWDSPWFYNMGKSEPNYWEVFIYQTTYKLKQALDYTHPDMDCQDVSGFLSLAFQSQGFDASCRVIENGDEPQTDDFWTNLVCPMGSDAAAPGDPHYSQTWFTFHQIVHSGMFVFDAAIAQLVDLVGNGFRNPPHAWDIYGYWQTAYPGAFYGLVDGPLLPRQTGQVTPAISLKAITRIE